MNMKRISTYKNVVVPKRVTLTISYSLLLLLKAVEKLRCCVCSSTCTINARVVSRKVNLYGFATHIISGRDGQVLTSGYDKVELYRMLRYANKEYLEMLNEEYLESIDFTLIGINKNVVLR